MTHQQFFKYKFLMKLNGVHHYRGSVLFIRFVAGIGLILTYVFQALPPLSELQTFGDISEFPLFFGTTLFAIEAVGVVVALVIIN